MVAEVVQALVFVESQFVVVFVYPRGIRPEDVPVEVESTIIFRGRTSRVVFGPSWRRTQDVTYRVGVRTSENDSIDVILTHGGIH